MQSAAKVARRQFQECSTQRDDIDRRPHFLRRHRDRLPFCGAWGRFALKTVSASQKSKTHYEGHWAITASGTPAATIVSLRAFVRAY